MPVPEDCRQWLATYFAVLKSNDLAGIQELSSVISAKNIAELPKGSPALMRESKKKMTATVLTQVTEQLGTIKSYSVVFCKETTIAKDNPMANAFGEGRHIEIICKTKYSKRKAQERFVLYKGPADTEFIVDAHSFTRSAL